MKKCLVFILLPIFLLKSQEWSTDSEYINNLKTITTAVPFLTIAPDSRSGAMGDLGVATTPDVYSLHWNSAKLAFLPQGGSFAISYTPWLSNLVPDISLSHITGIIN